MYWAQPRRAECDGSDAGENSHGQWETPGGQRPVGSALHASIGRALESLVQRTRPGGNHPDSEQYFDQSALHGRDLRLHGAEVEPAPSGDKNQPHHLNLEQLAEIVDQQSRCARLGCMETGHVRRIF